MPQMVCKMSGFEYPPGQTHWVGDLFEVEEDHVKTLEVTGRAELAGEPEQYRTRDIPRAPKRKRGRPPKVRAA